MVTRCTIGVQCPSNLQFSYKDKGGNSKDNFGFMCFRKKEEFYHNVTKLIYKHHFIFIILIFSLLSSLLIPGITSQWINYSHHDFASVIHSTRLIRH